MSEHTGEKTEQPTPRRLEEAWKRGQFPRSAEVQTAVVMGAGFLALVFTGPEAGRILARGVASTLGHLHDVRLTRDSMQGFLIDRVLILGQCVWPLLAATAGAGLLAGGMQSRFRAASEALEPDWNRINPATGFKRIASTQSLVNLGIGVLKLVVILSLTWAVIRGVLSDPIFTSMVDISRIVEFMGTSAHKIILRVLFSLAVIAAIDYGYQFYRNHHDMMMTRSELQEELKNTEGNTQVKSKMRRRAQSISKRRQLMDVPKADVVVTNPTHLAIALRYDRKTMRAPRIVAKGSRLNALQIREIARQHQVPILENKPLARLMFKYGRVGSEIPAQLYTAVAEVLAWVYRVNAYRYYRENNVNE